MEGINGSKRDDGVASTTETVTQLAQHPESQLIAIFMFSELSQCICIVVVAFRFVASSLKDCMLLVDNAADILAAQTQANPAVGKAAFSVNNKIKMRIMSFVATC